LCQLGLTVIVHIAVVILEVVNEKTVIYSDGSLEHYTPEVKDSRLVHLTIVQSSINLERLLTFAMTICLDYLIFSPELPHSIHLSL
jgi:hypothetical protein